MTHIDVHTLLPHFKLVCTLLVSDPFVAPPDLRASYTHSRGGLTDKPNLAPLETHSCPPIHTVTRSLTGLIPLDVPKRVRVFLLLLLPVVSVQPQNWLSQVVKQTLRN